MLRLFEFLLYELANDALDLLQPLWLTLGWKPVILGSDLLIYLLLLATAIWASFAMRREYWRAALRQVGSNGVAIACLVILILFGTIGMLDTLHFRNVSTEMVRGGPIRSVWDLACASLLENTEKTYSAPLQIYSFSKENMTAEDGSTFRDFPRLDKAGSHLPAPDDFAADLRGRFLKALGGAIGGSMVFVLLTLLYLRSKHHGQYLIQKDRHRWWVLGGIVLGSAVGLGVGLFIFVAPYYHLMGTDKAGLDVFYIGLKGIRTGLVIGTLTTLIVTPFAIFCGTIAGYFGGWIDDLIQYIYTTLSSIPDILLIAAAMLILQIGVKQEESMLAADKRLVYLCIIMGITSWTGLCRTLRAESLKLRELEYIQAASAFGVSRFLILLRHLVPNVMHIVLISVVLRFSGLVLAEAVLAYIGIGVDPSMQSWGNMVNAARFELARDPMVWWSLITAFVFMFALVLPANLFGDAVRDALDPRLRTR